MTNTLEQTVTFRCPGCGKDFSVPASFAGRKASCKNCGGPVVVPAAPDQPRVSMRTRRLIADAQEMTETFKDFPSIRIKSTTGDPPEIYRIEYHVTGLTRGWLGRPRPKKTHLVEIQLTSDYPRLAPQCKMLTPIFHPNIDDVTICVGDHWTAGERLVDLVTRIGEMIAYQAYNIQSPLNAEAAMWADLHPSRLPTDSRSMIPTA